MANITRYDPFNELVDDLFKGFFVRPLAFEPRAELVRMKLEVAEKNGTYLVTAELPGVKKEDIAVEIEGNEVTISAEVKREGEAKDGEKWLRTERFYGKSARRFALPQELDEGKAQARFTDGVLELTLPKKAAVTGRKIAVQ